jgi:alcohol dehydrogenase class IV
MSNLFLPRQIESDFGSLNQLGKVIIANGGSKPLVIMDSFLAKAPLNVHVRVKKILEVDHVECALFSDFAGEPTTDHVHAALKVLKNSQADSVIAVGGGSAIDIAKAVSLFGKSPDMKWEEITEQPSLSRLPLLAVPTTAGTGSEATKVMVITDITSNVKMNPGHLGLIPDAAILDPELTLSLPQNFTAYTGLDALTHAMEAYVSNRATVMTDLYALSAIRLIGKALPRIYEDGNDKESRHDMLLASCYAGIAFSNASTNLAHAAGRPLGARFHIPHGLSVAMLLPLVMNYGIDAAEKRYAEVAIALGADASLNDKHLAQISIQIVEDYLDTFGIWTDARKYIDKSETLVEGIPTLVEDALSGNGILTNIKIPNTKDVTGIYQKLVKKLFQSDDSGLES